MAFLENYAIILNKICRKLKTYVTERLICNHIINHFVHNVTQFSDWK